MAKRIAHFIGRVLKVTVIEPIALPVFIVIWLLLLPVKVADEFVKMWHES